MVKHDQQHENWWNLLSKKIEMRDVAGPMKPGPPRLEEMAKPPVVQWPLNRQETRKHVESYAKLSTDMGAVAAKVLSGNDIPLDLRSFYVGCIHPKCRWLNTNAFCPTVRTFPFEDMKEFVEGYGSAVAYKVLPPPEGATPDVGDINLDQYYVAAATHDKAVLGRNIARLRILDEMARRLYAAAYYDGHIQAAPISAGPCLLTKCADIGRCPAVERKGFCRFVSVAPVGSGVVYIDYHKLGRKLGWGELQVGGNCAFPEDVPAPDSYYNIGLILIE